MRKIAVLLSLVGAGIGGAIFACGSSDPGLPDLPRNDAATFDVAQGEAGGDGAPQGGADTFCKGTLGTYAASANTCCTAADKGSPEGSAFVSHAQTILADCVGAIAGSVQKGRTMFQPAQAQACIDAYTMQSTGANVCAKLTQVDPTVEPNALCAQAFVGLGDNNALCSADIECKDGLTCVGYGGGNDGTCRTPAAAGGACGSARKDGTLGALVIPMGSHPACAAGFYCDSATTTCLAQKDPGSGLANACTRNDQCSSAGRCDGTLHCTTMALQVAGTACFGARDCAAGGWCDHRQSDGGIVGKCTMRETITSMCPSAEETPCFGVCPTTGLNANVCISLCGSQ